MGGGAIIKSKPSNASNYSPRSRAVLAMLVLSGLMTALHGGAATGVTNQSTVPLVVCPTKFGTPRSTDVAKIPRTVEVSLSLKRASSVAVYTDRAELQTVLGPRDWRCSAYYGADGNGGVTIFPKSESIKYSGVYLDNDRDLQAINADWSPACADCILNQTCPFFARAKALYSSLGYPDARTNCRRPSGEEVLKVGTSLATFVDPAGVRGSATPSGGRYRALGLVYWAGTVKLTSGQVGANGSAVVSCTVTPALRSICQESFWHFERDDDPKLTTTK